jgi:hypothetical protein
MASEFLLERDQHFGMRLGIDLALQDALGTSHGKVGDTPTQLGPGLLHLLGNLGLAEATTLSASTLATCFASSTIWAPRFSAAAMMSAAFALASRRASAERLPASSSSCFPRSPAANPSAISFWRSAMAFASGGQTYFMVIQMKTPNQIASPINVALMFTLTSC